MSPILDRLGDVEVRFRPRSVSEFFALQLARQLGSLTHLRFCLEKVESHNRTDILSALARARKHRNGSQLADRFQQEVERLTWRHE